MAERTKRRSQRGFRLFRLFQSEIVLAIVFSCLLILGLHQWFLPESTSAKHKVIVLILEAVAVVGSTSLIFLVRVWGARIAFLGISRLYRGIRRECRRPVVLYLSSSIDDLTKLSMSDGLVIPWPGLKRLVESCFGAARSGTYIGADSNLPSEFWVQYPDFQRIQSRRGSGSSDVRYLYTTMDAFEKDRANNLALFDMFMGFHGPEKAQLFLADPENARRLSEQLSLLSPDFGVFDGKFVLYCRPFDDDGGRAFRVFLKPLEDGEHAGRLETYLAALPKISHGVGLQNGRVTKVASGHSGV
jgi:hypothetical protein